MKNMFNRNGFIEKSKESIEIIHASDFESVYVLKRLSGEA